MKFVIDFHHGRAVAIDQHAVEFALFGFGRWHDVWRNMIKLNTANFKIECQIKKISLAAEPKLLATPPYISDTHQFLHRLGLMLCR